MKSICLILLLLDFYIHSFPQHDSLVFYPVNNPVLHQYDIRRIAAGKDGKLWMSTGNGLLSYNGNDIKVYTHNPDDSSSLTGFSLSRSFIDRKGNLYAVIIGGQIDYFHTKTGKVERLKIKIDREDSSGYSLAFPYLDIRSEERRVGKG